MLNVTLQNGIDSGVINPGQLTLSRLRTSHSLGSFEQFTYSSTESTPRLLSREMGGGGGGGGGRGRYEE